MRVALITPMKPPDHPVPSGDRTFARLIREALTCAGHEALLVSDLVTWQRTPDGLAALMAAAEAERARIGAIWTRDGAPDAVLTYHNYHKAPDLLGPWLAQAFGLPYAIIEASRSPRRAVGPWAAHFALADEALRAADAVAAVTALDAVALGAFVPDRLVRLGPFVDTAPFDRPRAPRGGGLMVSAAMMRPGRKAQSVAVLAEVLRRVRSVRADVALALAGDGAERPALEPLFPAGTLVGLLDRAALADLFARGDVFVWPAIDEPFGFVFLEAQAAGLPVVAGRARGVVDVVREGETALLADPLDAEGLAGHTLALLTDVERRARMAAAARAFAGENDLAAGAARIDALLARAAARRAGAAA